MADINNIVTGGAKNKISDKQFLEKEIREFLTSPKRKAMIDGERYYSGEHDILKRKRTIIGEDGQLKEVENLPNNRIVDNQYGKMVDQKANYLLSKPPTFECENKTYEEILKKIFNNKFLRLLKNIGEDSLNDGIGWLYPYYNDRGELYFKRFKPYEILPFWNDEDHTILDYIARIYEVLVYEGDTEKLVQKVEVYDVNGIHRFVLNGGSLIDDIELEQTCDYIKTTDNLGNEVGLNWTKVPLIPFKFNSKEIPLIKRVRSLQDGINTILSDFENNMQEDARNTILVLKNYDGANLGEFRKNLSQYGAVKVRTVDGSDGGVETLTVEVNAENYKAIYDIFKKALIENARGFDAKDDRMSNNPNQMNIQSMYSDIDLDANGMETEYQASFEDLLWFITQHLANTGQGDFENEVVTITFNRDILINETESISNCQNSVGILSDETIVGQHPWVKDVNKELERKKKEQETDPYEETFNKSSDQNKDGAIDVKEE
ncbi:phage portal protein [Clostridium botulinum]|nr:phage portal protein [Clostridium botulinum]NFR13711.1 phage portal protein [Clostridium botulinum]NFR42222.1 phage portal protein [Clostridium botulinum]NFS50662.1 phage portal protein [Clostridium botulinum]